MNVNNNCVSLWARALVVLCGLCLTDAACAAEWTLQELMGVMSQQRSGRATFVEKKTMALLEKPLESSGELSFDAPDRLEKRTIKPRQESMVLEGDMLTVSLQGRRPVNLRLQDHPAVAATVESIRGTLAGDLAALEKNYAVEFSGQAGKWQLQLTPVHEAVAKIVRTIIIAGAYANVRSIRFEQADGDRTEMIVSKLSSP